MCRGDPENGGSLDAGMVVLTAVMEGVRLEPLRGGRLTAVMVGVRLEPLRGGRLTAVMVDVRLRPLSGVKPTGFSHTL